MAIEYETKVLDIDEQDLKAKLTELGAVQKSPKLLMKRRVFDIDKKLNDKGGFVRLRFDGKQNTMTYKKRGDKSIGNTEELETVVDDFDQTYQILAKLVWGAIYYQENYREVWILDDIEICIDTWPMVPVFIEIESNSIEKVKHGLKILGLEDREFGDVSHVGVYEKYGLVFHSYPVLKF